MSLYLKIVALLILLPFISFGQEQDSTWQEFSLGLPPLFVSLPDEPAPMALQIQPTMLDIISTVYAYQYEDIHHSVTVMLEQIAYAQHIHPDLTILADQAIRELQTSGVENVIFKTSTIEIEGRKGIRQNGNGIYKGNHLDFVTTILNENSKTWKVIIFSKKDDAISKRIAELILDSITFKN